MYLMIRFPYYCCLCVLDILVANVFNTPRDRVYITPDPGTEPRAGCAKRFLKRRLKKRHFSINCSHMDREAWDVFRNGNDRFHLLPTPHEFSTRLTFNSSSQVR